MATLRRRRRASRHSTLPSRPTSTQGLDEMPCSPPPPPSMFGGPAKECLAESSHRRRRVKAEARAVGPPQVRTIAFFSLADALWQTHPSRLGHGQTDATKRRVAASSCVACCLHDTSTAREALETWRTPSWLARALLHTSPPLATPAPLLQRKCWQLRAPGCHDMPVWHNPSVCPSYAGCAHGVRAARLPGVHEFRDGLLRMCFARLMQDPPALNRVCASATG
ncbi:hypothetical protein J1614_004548 [Plenodomus biglobosus]|nr:hypothetical protein J1614_004548 [Plenodomus biglobosus]